MIASSIKKSQGLTLIELLIVLAIVAVLAVIGVPSFNGFMAQERLAVATNELYGAYRFARNEAIKTSSAMVLDAVSSDWALGWEVKDSGGNVLLKSKVPHATITVSASAVTVQGMGSVTPTTSYSVTSSEGTNYICILASGQSKLQKVSCP